MIAYFTGSYQSVSCTSVTNYFPLSRGGAAAASQMLTMLGVG